MKFTKKGKVYFAVTVLFAVLLFVWLLIVVRMTGGRDIGEFTAADKKIMTVFAVVEGLTFILTFVFANFAGKENLAAKPMRDMASAARSEKTVRARGAGMQGLALLAAFGCSILGIISRKAGGQQIMEVCSAIVSLGFGLAVVLAGSSFLLHRYRVKRLNQMQISRQQEMLLSHRADPEKTAVQKLAELKKWRTIAGSYAVFLCILGACIAFCGGVAVKEYNAGTTLAAAVVIMAGFSRIRMATPTSVFQEDKTYLLPQEYPVLYAIARKAADKVGCRGQIRICAQTDERAGIYMVNQDYVLLLGVTLLHMYTEDELYHIMLHEFSHVEKENHADQKEQQYYNWLHSGKTPHFTSGISNIFFTYLDGLYGFTYMLYRYAVTIGAETAADQAMIRWGKPEIAASALLKLKYYELFQWEYDGKDERNLHREEEPGQYVLTERIQDFRQAMTERKEAWNRLKDAEILSRSASHPTVKMRLEQFGVPNPEVLPVETDSPYYQECCRLLQYMEKLVQDSRKETYKQQREYYYLKPLETVKQWEAAGKPLIPEEYADVVWSLRTLERTEEAIALLERAIEELPAPAACYAYYARGMYRLHRYEEAGVADLYFAVENNSNYLDEAMNAIGEFCCLTGNQKELSVFRQKAVLLAQKDKDVYSQMGRLTKKDKLSPEQLPDGMLEELLAYIAAADKAGVIENVYLVRKTITEDFFTSAVVVRFTDGTDLDLRDQLMHKIFSYLDTSSDWQFSLFDYREVKQVKLDRIENSCIYQRKIKR